MKKFLIVVDMQKDFVDGALGSEEALAIIPAAVRMTVRYSQHMILTLTTIWIRQREKSCLYRTA